MDYRIYRYFSSLHFEGTNPYLAKAVPWTDVNMSFTDPNYLDYSGLQLTFYNFAYWIGDTFFGQQKVYVGFILYSLTIIFISILAIWFVARQTAKKWMSWCLTILLFQPYFWYVSFSRSYEDKGVYLLIPTLVILTFNSRRTVSAACGLFAAWLGVGFLLFPIVLIEVYRNASEKVAAVRQIATCTAIFIVVFAVCMLPYFPESLIGWERRSNLENSTEPIWFSIWNLISPHYSSGLNRTALLCLSFTIYLLKWRCRISARASILMLVSLTVLVSINTPAQRIAPLFCVFVLAFENKRFAYLYTGFAFACSVLFFYFDRQYAIFTNYPVSHASLLSLFLSAPLFFGGGLLIFDQIRNRSEPEKSSESVNVKVDLIRHSALPISQSK